LQTELDLGWSDFGVRCFDNWKARWEGIDILTEYNAGTSPYAYTLGNPIRFSDPTGMISEDQDGLMYVSTDLWEGGRNQDFMNQSAAAAAQRAKTNQLQQAGYNMANNADWLLDGQLGLDLENYTFDGNYSTIETGRVLEGRDVRISHSWIWSGKPITGSGSGQGKTRVLDIVEKAIERAFPKSVVVHQVGITGVVSAGLGVIFSTGYTWDSNENKGWYLSIGTAHGFDFSYGAEYVHSRSIKNNPEFNIESLKGIGINYNIGRSIFDTAVGGDAKRNGNYNDQGGVTYISKSFGMSVGSPFGITRSVEQTSIWRWFNQKK
jgi:RHS repeat-associated protein